MQNSLCVNFHGSNWCQQKQYLTGYTLEYKILLLSEHAEGGEGNEEKEQRKKKGNRYEAYEEAVTILV